VKPTYKYPTLDKEETMDLDSLAVRRVNCHSSHHRRKEIHLAGLFVLETKGKENEEGG